MIAAGMTARVVGLIGALLGTCIAYVFGVRMGDWVAHLHDNPIVIGSMEYYRSLAYHGMIWAIPGTLAGYLVARATLILKR